jgi:predicted nucleic acid-binding protein
MRILLDTNIILDIALNRKPFVESSSELFIKIIDNKISAFVSSTTITDIYYIARKTTGHNKAISFIRDLLALIDVAGIDKTIIINALTSGIADFEDAIQVEASKSIEVETIITRNKKDFETSDLAIYTPNEFLAILNG